MQLGSLKAWHALCAATYMQGSAQMSAQQCFGIQFLKCKLIAGVCAGATQWDEPKGGQALTGPFVPSPTFTGAAAGYVFKMGPKGLGYYQDTASGTAYAVKSEAAHYIALFCARKTDQRCHAFTY